MRGTRSSLELGRADLAKGGVTTPLVLEHLDLIERGFLRMGPSSRSVRPLRSSPREPALDDVVAVASPAHGADNPVLLEAGAR